MVALVNTIVNSLKVVDYKLYGYRPLFLDGSKDAKSVYKLVEQIFSESISQSTLTPELDKAKIAALIGATERTVERATKKLVDEGRIFYEHTSKGKGRYSILFQQNMQLPEDCLLLDSELTTQMSVVAAPTTQASEINKLNITNKGEASGNFNSSMFSIISNAKKTKAESPTEIKNTNENSLQDNVVAKSTSNLSLVELPAKIASNTPSLLYSEQDIDDMIDGLTEDEEDCLSEQITELADNWENTSDLELQKHLQIEYKKSKCRHYGNWLWDKAEREVKRAYVIGLLEEQGYVYRNQNSLEVENQNNSQVENQSFNPTIANSSLTTTIPNTVTKKVFDQNFANPTESTSDQNVVNYTDQNVANIIKKSTENTTDRNVAVFCVKNVAVSAPITENSIANRLPALEIGKLRQKCRCFSKFSTPGAIPTTTNLHARTCVHARVRMREVKLIKLNKYNYINFLTLTSLKKGSICITSTASSNTASSNTASSNTASSMVTSDGLTTSTSQYSTITDNQTQESEESSNTPTLSTTPIIPTTTLDTIDITNIVNATNTTDTTDTLTTSVTKTTTSTLEEQNTIATIATNENNGSNNTNSTTRQNTCLKLVSAIEQTGKKAKKAKGEVEEPTPEMIQRLELDRISPKDFSLWKIVDKDFKIEQDSNGNYLLPNDLNNYPFSKYSFWDILAYAQTQGSIKKPASFSVSSYYSGSIETYSTFHKYLKEKATSSIGKARKPTEPTPQEKLASEKAKEELEQQLRFESLKETRWNSLSTDEQQSLLVQEIQALKADKNFAPYYEKWSKGNMAILQDYATNRIKTKLAEKELVKATELTAINQQANC